MVKTALVLTLLVSTVAMANPTTSSPMTIHDLKCEFLKEPLGIDASTPRLSWKLKSHKRNQNQSAYRILVASSPTILEKNQGDLWDSGTTQSSQQNNIPYSGNPLQSGQACYWKVQIQDSNQRISAWSPSAKWEMALLNQTDWKAQWLNDGKNNPAKDKDFYRNDPAPLFRKSFNLTQSIKRARLYVTGIGYYEASLNGQKVGNHALDPGWTAFQKRIYYSTCDVTKQLKKGENCLGITLGNGWYNPLPLKMWGNRNIRESLTTGRPRFIAHLKVELQNGKTETIISDQSWKVSDGPILRNNLYLGEVHDANKEQPGWNRSGFDDSNWRTPGIAQEEIGTLVAQPLPPICVTNRWNATKVTMPKPATYVYDMGTNFTGWLQLHLDVPRNTKIQIRFGELLNEDGTVNPMTSVAGQIKAPGVGGPGAPDVAEQIHTYIAKGGGEIFTPKFSFHGFRYAQITGLKQPLTPSKVIALRLNSDITKVGTFKCSNPMLNQIQDLCTNTFLSNILSVQSDCPHREKFGYGGDIGATSDALMANFDMSTFYAKAVQDWSDSALPNGIFTDTAPSVGIQYCGVGWALAHPLLITQLRQYYGNSQINVEEYAAAKKWLLQVEKQTPTKIITNGLSDHEGLEPAPSPEMVTPLYYKSAKLLAQMATNLNKTEDATYFTNLADSIQNAYNLKFTDPTTGKVGPGSQASQAFGLATGIIPESTRPHTMNYLISQITEDKNHLSTGIYGTKFLLDELSRDGKAELAYKIVTQPDFPGWGWMLQNGATTLWEHWQFSDNTFSHNHPMFGSVSQWMMQWLGGIQPAPDAVGFNKIIISPQTISDLSWVESSHNSIRGKIISNWSRQNETTTFEITIPPNTQAQISLPAKTISQITESGNPIIEMNGLIDQPTMKDSTAKFSIGSGQYKFKVIP